MATGSVLSAQSPVVTTVFSTHDATTTPGVSLDRGEVWADVKAPGDERIYAVGSAFVPTPPVPGTSTFSGQPIDPEVTGAPNGKWVVVLQVTNSAGDIRWQRHFFGSSNLPVNEQGRRGTNARGISVWVGATPLQTRIAICGETYDDTILASQAPSGWQQSTQLTSTPDPAGFVAVYNGEGDLLWSHHFFGSSSAPDRPDCAITDVSMRVEQRGEHLVDVVTWCGISSHGNPAGGNAWLTPVRAFQGPVSSGDVDHGPGQWDGIVGRLSRVQGGSTTVTEFLSIVGGSGTDGLFGIAELDDQRVVVVGSSQREGDPDFPITRGAGTGAHRVGVVLTFDASATLPVPPGPSGNLVLEAAQPMGTYEPGTSTVARDVVVLPQAVGFGDGSTADRVVVVGQTDDAAFLASVSVYFPVVTTPGLDVYQGATDGFVLSGCYIPGAAVLPYQEAVYLGTAGVDGLTGVAAWGEHADHVATIGFTNVSSASQGVDLEVASWFFDTTQAPSVPTQLLLLRREPRGGTGIDEPTAMGDFHATMAQFGLPFPTGVGDSEGGLGGPQGGGIAVDHRARTTLVGATRSLDYRVQDFVPASAISPARGYFGAEDAVRTEVDLLPAGAGRTDFVGVAGFAQPPGFSGGTTPACALSPYGDRIGEPAPLLRRMLVDIEGNPDPVTGSYLGSSPNILVLRPPTPAASSLNVIGSLLQFTLPGSPYAPLLDPSGIEYWATDPGALLFLDLWTAPSRSFRKNFGSTTTPLGTVGVQWFVLLDAPVPGGLAPNCGQPSSLAASPALWFPYF